MVIHVCWVIVEKKHTRAVFLMTRLSNKRNANGLRSDKRDLMAIKVKSNSFTRKERPPYCEQLLKI